MPLDPDVARLLEQMPPFDTRRTPAEMRADGARRRPPGGGDQRVTTADLDLPGPAGTIRARRYTPPEGNPAGGLLVFLHGGGFVLGDLETHDAVCRDLAAGSGVEVLAVDYRLAPEHPFPAGLEDAWAALGWAHDHATELGADPGNLAVGGDSAGGNLAAVTALLARDAGIPLRLQLLVYPATDFHERRPSVQENAGYVLSPEAMDWFEGHYAPDRADWRASVILAPDLAGVAPALVLTCELDPLRDEGNAYAERLAAAGVPVTHRQVPGMVHGSLGMGSVVPAARALMDASCAALRQALRPGATAPAS